MARKIYATKQVTVCDCGHDYATHKKSLRGKLICVYRTRVPMSLATDKFTITMKKLRKVKKTSKLNR